MTIELVPPDQLEAVRGISKLLLGSRYRLEVGAAIAVVEPGTFFAKQLADELGIGQSLVSLELDHFTEAGLIERLDRVRGVQMRYFRRRESVFWNLCIDFLQELKAALGSVDQGT